MAIDMSASQLSIHGQLKSFHGNKSRPGCKIIQNPFRKWMAELDTSCRRRTSFTGMPWLSNATLAGPAGVAPSSPVLAYQSEDPTAGCTMLAPDAVARSKYPAATHELTRQSCDKVVIGFRIPQQEFQNDFHSVKKTLWSSPLTEAIILINIAWGREASTSITKPPVFNPNRHICWYPCLCTRWKSKVSRVRFWEDLWGQHPTPSTFSSECKHWTFFSTLGKNVKIQGQDQWMTFNLPNLSNSSFYTLNRKMFCIWRTLSYHQPTEHGNKKDWRISEWRPTFKWVKSKSSSAIQYQQ